ncbi:MAG TPA: hypothetical protein VN766_05040, partial [Stellaceae bacterium]|jgi:hypothetical protein|nr:hypothetical protein [Stellaceae bacterium]
MNKARMGMLLSASVAFGALVLIPARGADAAVAVASPFGGGALVPDSALAEMRGGFNNLPFGLDLDIHSFANGHEIASMHVDNDGGNWHVHNQNFNKTIDVTNLAGPGNLPNSTTVTNLLTSSAVITQIQNNQPNANLSTLQTVNAALSGGGLADLMKSLTNQATQAALLNILKPH